MKGLIIEIIQDIQNQLNDRSQISIVPWPRAYHSLLTKPNVVFTSISRTPERERLFSMVGPIGIKGVVFFKRKNSPLKINSIEDVLKVKRIAVRRNTIYETLLRQKGFKDLITTENTLQNLRLLYGNRVDLFLDADNQTFEIMKKEKVPLEDIHIASVLTTLDTYIAFSKGTSPQVIEEWKVALQKMKANGRFEEIYRKWLP